MRTAPGTGHAMESLEQLRHFLRRNTGAGIPHGEFEVRSRLTQADFDLAVEGKLEGVRNEVEDNLLPHFSIDEGWLGQWQAVDGQLQSGLLDGGAEHASELGRERGK